MTTNTLSTCTVGNGRAVHYRGTLNGEFVGTVCGAEGVNLCTGTSVTRPSVGEVTCKRCLKIGAPVVAAPPAPIPATTADIDADAIEYVSTDELREGDVLESHGMILEIDRPIENSIRGCGTTVRTVYWTAARVCNLDEIKAKADAERERGIGNPHYGFILHFVNEDEGRWNVQGNDLARWTRIRR
jgi:hypothetical protein